MTYIDLDLEIILTLSIYTQQCRNGRWRRTPLGSNANKRSSWQLLQQSVNTMASPYSPLMM